MQGGGNKRMKISFWSPVHGQTGTTSNIIISAMLTGMIYRKKCILTQTQFNFNNLEAPLVGCNSKDVASPEFFRDVGLDTLIRNFKAEKINGGILENCCISFHNTNVRLLPGTAKSNKDSFGYEMETVLLNLLRTMEEFSGILFIDAASGNNPLSMKIIADSNLTIVNFSQNMSVIDTFFTEYRHLIKGNVFYLFGNYDCNSRYNINNIRTRYRKDITILNSGVIPYCTAYMDAQCGGRVVEFIRDNLTCSKNDDNHYFIQKAKSAIEKILKMAGHRIYADETKGCN